MSESTKTRLRGYGFNHFPAYRQAGARASVRRDAFREEAAAWTERFGRSLSEASGQIRGRWLVVPLGAKGAENGSVQGHRAGRD